MHLFFKYKKVGFFNIYYFFNQKKTQQIKHFLKLNEMKYIPNPNQVTYSIFESSSNL